MRPAIVVALGALLLLSFTAGDADARRRRGRKGRSRAAPTIPARTASGLPNVMSASAVLVDLDAHEELYAKDPDAVRPIASVGKLFVALVVRDKGLPLDGQTAITEEDQAYARGGARSRLHVGKSFGNHDLLRAMLISSDNRAVTALGRAAGMTPDQLIAAINAKVKQLGLRHTSFSDPTGLNGNVSTPREVLVALEAALADPVLAEIMATPHAVVTSTSDPRYAVEYTSTDLALRAGRYPVLGGKTGYTDEARYCLAIAATLNGRRIGMVFLGAEGELTRFADFNRAAEWFLDTSRTPHELPASAAGVGAGAPPPAMTTRLK